MCYGRAYCHLTFTDQNCLMSDHGLSCKDKISDEKNAPQSIYFIGHGWTLSIFDLNKLMFKLSLHSCTVIITSASA